MSGWEAWTKPYVDQGVASCGIFGLDGSTYTSTNLNIGQEDTAKIHKVMQEKSTDVYTNGIILGGEKWSVILMDEDVMVLKGKDTNNAKKTMSVKCAAKSMVIGTNRDNSEMPGQSVRSKVEELGTSLKNSGY